MKKIAICIPSYMEEDTISRTTQVIDNGLDNFKNYKIFIVNADNTSQDKTKERFLATPTKHQKIYLPSEKRGKGANILNFLKYCQDNQIDYAASFDADLFSIEPNWIKLILDPIVSNHSDYITPLYERKRFEGSTTNLFAFPLIFAYFGQTIRQPIGGEFAFNKRFINYLLDQKIDNDILEYGIDIFMTIHALGGKFKIQQVFLGKKFHKPSFPKIEFMPKQVFSAAFFSLKNYHPISNNNPLLKYSLNLNSTKKFPHHSEAEKLRSVYLDKINKDTSYAKILTNWQEIHKSIVKTRTIDDKLWPHIIAKFIAMAEDYEPEYLAQKLLPLFIIRTVSFWNQASKISANRAEEILANQAVAIREAYFNLVKAS